MEPTIVFHTNLDHPQRFVSKLNEEWAGPVPLVGHRIEFEFEHLRPGEHPSQARKFFDLVVVEVTWLVPIRSQRRSVTWVSPEPHPLSVPKQTARVELHIPPHFRSIAEWESYYRRHVEGREP